MTSSVFPSSVVLGPASLGLSAVVPRWLLQLQPSNMHFGQEGEERSGVSHIDFLYQNSKSFSERPPKTSHISLARTLLRCHFNRAGERGGDGIVFAGQQLMWHLEFVRKRSCRLWTLLIISIVLSWFSHCVCGRALNRGLRAGEPSILDLRGS